ncbi:MAG: heparinase II/III family protein, partial [Clostridia bacterium]|nr:heparinase II/III family protein [Clostridia bacterium]
MDIKQFELEDIKISYLTSENPDNIKLSLNLLQNGIFRSDIKWTSSDTSTITNSGRVIRPRFDEHPKTVTLTASIGEYKKDFIFKVAPDEMPVDPMHTSDEEFFGVWNGSAFSVSPQLNYEISELSDVLACVKNNDYASARNALHSYFKTREVLPPIGLGNRHTGWVDARADGLLETGEEASYWKGHMIITSDEFEPVTISVYKPESISPSKCKTFELISRYNESSSAYILGTGNADLNSVPKLQLKVNGSTRIYTATNTATIRAGKYSQTHINDTSILEAKMFGDFLGDNTSRILLAFDLSDISSSDSITDAQLTVYARKSNTSADNKELWLIDNRDKEWSENTVFWDSLNFNVHNYNGLNGGADWKGARASDVEYAYQAPRFTHARSTMAEYKATGNEKYAYSLLGQVFDIIKDTGAVTPYPRSLDASGRMQQLVPLMNTFKNSPYLTADFCTAFMKYMYKQFEYFPTRADATGNWREYEQLAVLYATAAYPELSNSQTAKDACVLSWQNALSKSFMPDGSYIEDTGGYHRSSFNMYRDFKKSGISSGVSLPEEFDIRLHKAAYYMALTNGPDGLTLQYGDESGGKSSSNRYSDIADWYDDDELRFIDSFGTTGTKPSWTSYQFPDGRYTIMRSDWKQDAIYLHTNVRGGGGHGHADDNNIILMAGDRRLLVDAGRFTYNTYDPARLYGLSTQGHNTLVINDTSQRMGWTDDEYSVRGNINQWTSNSEFDMLSQSTISY